MLARRYQSSSRVYLKPVRVRFGRVEDRVGDDRVVALVAVQGRQLEDGRTRVGHLEHVGVVHGLIELGSVVIGIGDAQVEGTRRVQRWRALIGGRDDQRVVGLHLAIQRQRHDHQVDDVVARRQAKVALAAVQRHVDVGVLFLGVGIVDGDACHELARLGILRDLGRGVIAQEDQVDGRLVVVDVGDADRHEGGRLQCLDAAVAGHDDQLVHLLGLEVERPVDRDDTGARIDDEHRVAIALAPVDRVGDAAVVARIRVGGEHLQDAGADGGVLRHRGEVARLVENRLVVVDVLDRDVDRHESLERRVAAVERFDHQAVKGRRFAVQEAVDLQVQVQHSVALAVRRQSERVVGVARHDVVALRVEDFQIEVLGRR